MAEQRTKKRGGGAARNPNSLSNLRDQRQRNAEGAGPANPNAAANLRSGEYGQQKRGTPHNQVGAQVRKLLNERCSEQVVELLAAVVNGQPLPIYDEDGTKIGEGEPANTDQRIRGLEMALKRLVPELKSVDITGADAMNGLSIQVVTGASVPGSQTTIDAKPAAATAAVAATHDDRDGGDD